MSEENKKEPSPYFPNSNNLPPKQKVVTGQIIPKLLVGNMLENFNLLHSGDECPPCERIYVQSMVCAFSNLGLPPYLIQHIVDEWMRQIRANPPGFTKEK